MELPEYRPDHLRLFNKYYEKPEMYFTNDRNCYGFIPFGHSTKFKENLENPKLSQALVLYLH